MLQMTDDIFSPDACDSSVGSRISDSAFQLPWLREEAIGLGLDLVPLGLFRGTISVDNPTKAASQLRRLACPLKPRLVPVLDTASPSPIVSLPSPIMVTGAGTTHGMLTTPLIWSATLPHQLAPPLNLGIEEGKTSLTFQSASADTDGPLLEVGLGIRRSAHTR